MIKRLLNLPKKHSLLLLGPRGCGKSTLVNAQFGASADLFINLLDTETYARLSADPAQLSRQLVDLKSGSMVIIDEIQRIPELLNTVHQYIETKKIIFILTGSSARKLRRGASNLLAGRAFVYTIHPLTHKELGAQFDFSSALTFGTLPTLLSLEDDADKIKYLKTYALTYVQEEIVAEQILRVLPPFRRFLEVAAQTNATIVNYSKVARDIQSTPTSVQSYYQILDDTLLGFFLEPYHKSIRKRKREAPKFYLFDTGICRALNLTIDDPLRESTYEFGKLFESFIINEIKRLLDYSERSYRLSYLRTKANAEIDLIVEIGRKKPIAIEIKSTKRITAKDVATFSTLAKDLDGARILCLSCDPTSQNIDGVEAFHWERGIQEILDS